MKSRGDERGVYIALDESNHGRIPEILVAVSSVMSNDAISVRTSGKNRMEEGALIRFLRNGGRDFRYYDVNKRKEGNHLVTYASELICDLLESENKRFDFLDIMVDGELRRKDMEKIMSELNPVMRRCSLRGVGIRQYPKSRNKTYDYPRLLVAADSLAHYIFRQEAFRTKIKAAEKRIKVLT